MAKSQVKMATIDLTRDQSCAEFRGKKAAIAADVLGCKIEECNGADGLMHDFGSVANEREQYWCRQLSGIGPIDIPVDYPRTIAVSNRKQAIPIKVSGRVVEGLNKICKSCECTPYVGFLAAFQVFLSRYCGNARDIVVGAPLTFTKRLEQRLVDAEIILQLHMILNGNPSFTELLQQAHVELIEAVKHVIFPDNTEVIEKLQDPGQLTTALNTMIILQNQNNSMSRQHFEDRELFLKQRWNIELEANVEIALKLDCGKMEEHGGDINGIWEYNAELLDPSHVDSMAQNFHVMLNAIVAETPIESVWKLPLLTEDEQKKLLVEWNNTYEPQPKSDMLLHELFLDQVKTVGTNVFAVTEYGTGRNITYQELKNNSEILSQQMRQLGVKSNTAIGVFIPGGTIEAIAAIFGILMAGCAYVPLDTDFPSDRIKLIVEDADLKAILVMEDRAMSEVDIAGAVECSLWNVKTLLSYNGKTSSDKTFMKTRQTITSQEDGDYTTRTTSHGDLYSVAYIMYTSASTGPPKGVVVEHAQICHFVQLGSPLMFPGLGLGSQLLLTSPLSSDVSCGTIFPALISGALLVLASKWEIVDFLEDIIISKGISHLYITRSLFNLIAMSDLPSLQAVNITGETPQQSHIDIWRDKVPYLLNAYGSTEINVITTQQFKKTDTLSGATIGRPFPNTTCFVLDELLQLVPVGAVGELYVGGPQLAREYLSRPDLTNKVFIPNPFIPGDRLYKTGDLVKYKPDGSLVFRGRNDTCVKIRGQRIELEEVETALMNVGNGTINTSMVVVIDDYLVGFVTPNDVNVGGLRNRLHSMLPAYMVPSLVMAVKSIPTTTSGKADSISLKAILEEMVANKRPSVMCPATSTSGGIPSLSSFTSNNDNNTCDSLKQRPSFVKRGSIVESMITVQAEERLEGSLNKGYDETLQFLKLSSCNSLEKQNTVLQILTEIVHAIVGKMISPQQSLMNGGIDSVTLPIFASEIQKLIMQPAGIDQEVNATRLFEFSSLHKLSRWIVSCLESSRKPATPFLSSQCNAESMSHRKLHAKRSTCDEIAVVGMACRFPGGANSPDLFWSEVLSQGKDCVVPVPPSRFGLSSGTVWHGGLINGIDLFDNKLFGISPAEVDQMDPNQRHMLEIGYEVLMRAGFTVNELEGKKCGVFVGVDNSDWAEVNSENKNRRSAYSVMGSSDCSVSNRLSHFLGLTGPSITINTACSSSLVALDSALASLFRGQCDMAVVGGVNVLLSYDKFKRLDATGFISANGRCRAFDASADGYARGEGAGAVVLMPLPEAQERGCKIEALVRGTATSHCGTGSNFTAPNPSGQRQVIADALQDAGIEPQDVCYVETHGSGTSLGNPIEIDSILSVLGVRQKNNNPLVIGAVKTNIGHLEGAAGIAGLIKTILVLQHRMAPPNLHLKTVNPHISNTESSLIFPSKLTPLGSTGTNGTLFAGVSSFGAGGSNAHAVLSSYVSEQKSPKQEDWRVAFLFSGQGSEFVGMGRELYVQHEEFRKNLQQCDAILTKNGWLDTSIIGLIYPSLRDPKALNYGIEDNLIHETRYSQPVLFCFEWALAQALIHDTTHHPFAVMGHSVGELVAACVAGFLPLEDGLMLVAKRGAAMQGCPSVDGAMFALRVSRLEAEARIRDTGLLDKVVVSASNSPHSCTVSGSLNDLNILTMDWGVSYRQLNVSHAFHSQEMQPAVPVLKEALCQISSWKETSTCMVSTANAKPILSDTIHDPEYWTNQMLSPVLFSEALHNLLSSTNVSCFVEVGPRSILTNFFRDHDFKNIGCIDVMMNEECPMETYLKAVKQLLPPISRAPTFNHVAFSFWQPTPPEPVLYTTEWEHIQTSASSSSVSSRDVAINMVESPLTEFFSKVSAAVERVQVIFTNEQDCGSCSVNGTTTWNTVALGSSVDLLEGLNYLISALKCAFEQSCCLLVVTEGVLGGNLWRGAWILGFLRSARIEFVGLDINYIDFCSDLTLAESTIALSYILNNKNRGVEMVVNSGPILKIARLIPMSIDFLKNSDGSLNFPSCATYIISGGLGALGLRAAQTLIKNGACHLILLSRSGVPSCSESQHLLSSLQEVKNVKIICMACDISTDVGIKALKAITRSCLTVKGIVHAAGVMTEPDSILNTSLASLERTISPKLQGAWNLHLMSLQEGRKLDFFVVYSSASGILGFGGQSSYAASNTALDALVKLRRGQKLCGTSLQWGEWGIGMGTKTMKSDKVVQITPQMGSSILEAALAHPDTSPPEILVLPSQNWGDYTHLLRQEHLPLFAKVLVSSETPQELDISSSQCNVSHITNDKNWLEYMCEMAARIAGQPVNPTDKLVTIMDSLAQMEFYHRLNDALVEAGCERLKRNFLSMGIYSLEGILASISTSAEGNNSSSSPSQREEEAFTVKPGDCPSEIEASYEQTQMYLIHMLMPDKSTYNQLLGVRLRNAPVDIDAICYALDMVWGRHDVLRVALRMVSPPPQYVIMQYVKSVSEAPHFPLKLCEAVDGASLTQTLRDALQEPFNMEEGPLIWARLVTVSPEDVTLSLVIHHAICDAHSCKSIISEIMTVYSDRIGGRESSLELRAVIQYSDYAVAQRKWLDPNGERFLNYLTYWKNKLADLKPIDLPLDRPRAPVLSNRGAVIHVSVPFNVISALLKVCHAKSCTLFVGITSLWGLLIARCSGDASEVVVGMPYNSRNHEMYEMQGDVINLLPLRLNFGGDSTFGGILERANKDVQDAVKHGDGFAGVVMRLGIVPDPSRTPLFDTVLILQDNRVSTDNMKADVLSKVGACEVEIISRGHPFMDEISRSSFEISCEFTTPEPGSDMKGVITYNPDLFDDISIQKIADSYVTILDEAGKLGLRSNVWNLPLLN